MVDDSRLNATRAQAAELASSDGALRERAPSRSTERRALGFIAGFPEEHGVRNARGMIVVYSSADRTSKRHLITSFSVEEKIDA
jgi:hypothetical protein